MRIVLTLVCTLLLSLALPSLSFAGSDCDDAGSVGDIRDCLNDDDHNGKSEGKGKGKAKGHDKDDDDDYKVSCMEILNRDRRRECLERRAD